MKALAMLDHVMLWVARICGVGILAQMLFVVEDLCSSYYSGYLYVTHHHQIWHWQRALLNEENYTLLFLLLVSGLWTISLWWLKKSAARFYLLLSGALMSAGFFDQLSDLIVMHPHLPTGQEWLMATSYPFGFLAMAWTGFRAPGLPPMKWMPSIPRRQSVTLQPPSANLFRSLSPSA
jgi:hypothetical protein